MSQTQTLEWTPERVSRFWDYWSQRRDGSTYFSQQVGAGVLNLLGQYARFNGTQVLDFGAGPGYLVEGLLNQGAKVAAVDYSPQSVMTLNGRFANHPGWTGARAFQTERLPWADNSFDIITCVETLEHLLDRDCELVLTEILRVLKAEGTVLFTTPNDEKLQNNYVFCPCCSTEFHRWQHVRSWNPTILQQKLSEIGYQVVDCRGLNFRSLQGSRLRRLSERLVRWLLQMGRRAEAFSSLADHLLPSRLLGNQQHHLAAVARKR